MLFWKLRSLYQASKLEIRPASHLSRTAIVCQRVKSPHFENPHFLVISLIDKLLVSEPKRKITEKQARLNVNSIADRAQYNSIKSSYMHVAAGVRVTLKELSTFINIAQNVLNVHVNRSHIEKKCLY